MQQLVGQNIALTTSGNEYSIAIPSNVSNIKISLADQTNTAKIYNVSVGNGGSPANYWTLGPGEVLEFSAKFGPQTIFIMPGANTLIAQVLYIADT